MSASMGIIHEAIFERRKTVPDTTPFVAVHLFFQGLDVTETGLTSRCRRLLRLLAGGGQRPGDIANVRSGSLIRINAATITSKMIGILARANGTFPKSAFGDGQEMGAYIMRNGYSDVRNQYMAIIDQTVTNIFRDRTGHLGRVHTGDIGIKALPLRDP
ncbi:hypothetical protein O1611_g7701 [Lasiodiplodia mahajangana]|uniref:Uncharacterized protein n=1 Tax=Lasiodiplodia mahajangana TaxID=1108764 RepID=A0ACC2JEU2_9PEZI|nr:hypothetical protein O1611_g7701 [Lasiodiplodia mahajangana]